MHMKFKKKIVWQCAPATVPLGKIIQGTRIFLGLRSLFRCFPRSPTVKETRPFASGGIREIALVIAPKELQREAVPVVRMYGVLTKQYY